MGREGVKSREGGTPWLEPLEEVELEGVVRAFSSKWVKGWHGRRKQEEEEEEGEGEEVEEEEEEEAAGDQLLWAHRRPPPSLPLH